MTGALLITRDPRISGPVQELAARAGVRLSVRADLASNGRAVPALSLVGADRVTAAVDAASPVKKIITVDRTFPAAAAAVPNGPPVLSLPRDEQQLVRLFEEVAAPVLERLRAAGYRIGFTDRERRQAGFVTPLAVTDWRLHPGQAVYVNCGRFACGDAATGLAHVVQRSNFRRLHRRFRKAWTDTVARDMTELGAFVADLPQAAVNALCSMTGTDAVLDEDDHQALRGEDIAESWAGIAAVDLYAQLRPACRQVWDLTGPERITELMAEVVTATGVGPVHDGWHVRWPITDLAPRLAARLLAEQRRTRHRTGYRTTRLPDHTARHRYAGTR